LINVESPAELRELDRVAHEKDIVAGFGIRVNPDVATDTHPYTQTGERGMKFGVPMHEVLGLAKWAYGREHLELRGIGMHIGSQITSAENYREGASRLAGLVTDLRSAGVGTLQSVDVGGGLGIQYTDETALTAAEFAAAVRPLLDSQLTLLVEPGRFLVGNAGLLLTRCVYRKKSGQRNFVVVDAGMNDFLRPSHYGAVHEILAISDSRDDPETVAERCDVVGPICETGDFLGFEREFRAVGSGSLLAVLGAGAYGFTMSSTYNSRPRAAEVLIDGDRWAIVREREKVSDLMRGEVLLGQAGLQWRTVAEGRSQ
jgi:diaminopimelate decarboxylase